MVILPEAVYARKVKKNYPLQNDKKIYFPQKECSNISHPVTRMLPNLHSERCHIRSSVLVYAVADLTLRIKM